MSSAALNTATRSALTALVERERSRTGSRTVAYENVAASVGTSSSWIRKFMAGSDEVAEPRMTLFQNIRQNYDNLCARVERENEMDEQRLLRVRGELHAATAGIEPKSKP